MNTIDTLETLRRWEAKQAAADSLLFNSATFVCDADRGVYVVEVRGHVVAEPRTLGAVRAFCEMHNGRLADSLEVAR